MLRRLPEMSPVWDWPNSTILRVVDGDTVVALLCRDIGFHGITQFVQKLRLNRINSVPVKTAHGLESKRFLEELVTPNMQQVHIQTVKPYKFGDEWMCEIILVDGRNVSDEMVKNAMAVYWDGTGTRPDG